MRPAVPTGGGELSSVLAKAAAPYAGATASLYWEYLTPVGQKRRRARLLYLVVVLQKCTVVRNLVTGLQSA